MRYSVRENGKYLFLEGTINSSFLNKLEELFDDNSNLAWVVLTNVPGGMDDTANLLGSIMVREAGLNTYIPQGSVVASGGTNLFTAGVQRVASHNAIIGVHSWSGYDDNGSIVERKNFLKNHKYHQPYLEYYKVMGIPANFY